MIICLERCADLHMAQLMPLPLTVSCSSKIQIGFTYLVPAYPGCPGKEAVVGCNVVVLTLVISEIVNSVQLQWCLLSSCNVVCLSFVISYLASCVYHSDSPKCTAALGYRHASACSLAMCRQWTSPGTDVYLQWVELPSGGGGGISSRCPQGDNLLFIVITALVVHLTDVFLAHLLIFTGFQNFWCYSRALMELLNCCENFYFSNSRQQFSLKQISYTTTQKFCVMLQFETDHDDSTTNIVVVLLLLLLYINYLRS